MKNCVRRTNRGRDAHADDDRVQFLLPIRYTLKAIIDYRVCGLRHRVPGGRRRVPLLLGSDGFRFSADAADSGDGSRGQWRSSMPSCSARVLRRRPPPSIDFVLHSNERHEAPRRAFLIAASILTRCNE